MPEVCKKHCGLPEEEQVAFRFGAGGVVQVLGTGQAESVKSSRRHKTRPPHRKQFTRQRLPRGSAESPNWRWKFRSKLGKFIHRCQSCRVRSMRSSGNEMQVVQRRRRASQVDGDRSSFLSTPTDLQELEGWFKRPELRFAERNRVREPRTGQSDWCLIGQGAGQVAKVGRGSVVEGQSRSMMSNLIEEQSRRCCLSFRRSIDIAELIGARYGLREVRPGPPFDPPPNPASCPDDVLASLEADLTRIIRRTTSLWCAERQVGSSRAELV